jgi:hypothetical protein
VAAWDEQLRSTQTIAAMAIRFAELDGVPPPEPDDADGAAARVTELVADLVEPARVTALEKLGEGARASGLAARWVRSQLGPARGDDAPTVTASSDR